jgi:hypothetical protein
MKTHRPIRDIAAEIRADWRPVHGEAEPYVAAMEKLNSVNDSYHADSAVEVLSRFRWAARTWRGPTAVRIKKEIEDILKNAP